MALRELTSEEIQYVLGGTEVAPVIVTASKAPSGWYSISDFGAIMDFSMWWSAQADSYENYRLSFDHATIGVDDPKIRLFDVKVTDTTTNTSYFFGIDENTVSGRGGTIEFNAPQSVGAPVTFKF